MQLSYPRWTHQVVPTAVEFAFLQIENDARRPGWVREITGLLHVVHKRLLLSMLDSFSPKALLRSGQVVATPPAEPSSGQPE